jgi:signal transduction histidine kinase
MADIQQLKQVLINLVKNAAESLGGDGTVTLRGRKGTRQLRGKVCEVAIIEVEDTGPGIPLEIRGKIFDPFFSTKGDGTGLGLAIASRIIDKHGGNLEFDTQLGKGTIFRIVLPPSQSQKELIA